MDGSLHIWVLMQEALQKGSGKKRKKGKKEKKKEKRKELSLTSAAALTNQQVHQGAASQPIFLAQGFIYKDYTTPTSKRKKKNDLK